MDVHDNEKFRNFHNKLSRFFRNMRYYINIDVYGNNGSKKLQGKGNMRQQLNRIISDKKSIGMIIFMLVIPILDIVQIYYQDIIKINGEMGKPYPLYVTFLSCYSQGHIFQMIYLWFLPLYLLVIVGEESIVDYITGYKNILICKMGKNKYILQKMKSAFIVSFTIVFVGLGLNLILSQIVFNGGTKTRFDSEPLKYNSFVMIKTFLFEISYTHPLTTNIVYILITAIFAGVLGMMGAALAISIHERKMVYALTFAIWFIPILFKNSSMHIFQPFMEYDFNVIVPMAIWCIVLYILVIITAIIWEKKIVEV